MTDREAGPTLAELAYVAAHPKFGHAYRTRSDATKREWERAAAAVERAVMERLAERVPDIEYKRSHGSWQGWASEMLRQLKAQVAALRERAEAAERERDSLRAEEAEDADEMERIHALTPAELDAELRAAGFDPEEIAQQGKRIARFAEVTASLREQNKNVTAAFLNASEALTEARKQRDHEVWCHAGCLTYAEGSKDRAKPELESLAMRTVWELREKYDEARAAGERLAGAARETLAGLADATGHGPWCGFYDPDPVCDCGLPGLRSALPAWDAATGPRAAGGG